MRPPIGTTLLICEHLLIEQDKVPSAIRMVDVFFVPADDKGNLPADTKVRLFVYCGIKLEPSDDTKHHVKFDVTLPDGRREPLFDTEASSATPSRFAEAPRGFLIVARLDYRVEMLGLHRTHAVMDGVEIATALFTIVGNTEKGEAEEAAEPNA